MLPNGREGEEIPVRLRNGPAFRRAQVPARADEPRSLPHDRQRGGVSPGRVEGAPREPREGNPGQFLDEPQAAGRLPAKRQAGRKMHRGDEIPRRGHEVRHLAVAGRQHQGEPLRGQHLAGNARSPLERTDAEPPDARAERARLARRRQLDREAARRRQVVPRDRLRRTGRGCVIRIEEDGVHADHSKNLADELRRPPDGQIAAERRQRLLVAQQAPDSRGTQENHAVHIERDTERPATQRAFQLVLQIPAMPRVQPAPKHKGQSVFLLASFYQHASTSPSVTRPEPIAPAAAGPPEPSVRTAGRSPR